MSITTYDLFKAFIPDLDRFEDISNQKIMISAVLTKSTDPFWDFKIYETFQTTQLELDLDSEELRNVLSWVESQLTNWPGCTRKSYNHWTFDNKRQAHKFLVLFNLKCTG